MGRDRFDINDPQSLGKLLNESVQDGQLVLSRSLLNTASDPSVAYDLTGRCDGTLHGGSWVDTPTRTPGGLDVFGLELDGSVEVRVWDSNAEVRYMVLPERPAGTEKMSEAELTALVTRDSMVGVSRVKAPASVA